MDVVKFGINMRRLGYVGMLAETLLGSRGKWLSAQVSAPRHSLFPVLG